ncbi:hypothetical protein P775_19680 [Puniceibacterium antarcticum]|uniref:Uncharacterized protein n=1 Tax=Puniceibacterium antarcticum TaxID=1206336 RepID=A0A2G8RB83_9RHOB|nr:hypothetical protein P775_19680 [Puniceibacterium antarcticum]
MRWRCRSDQKANWFVIAKYNDLSGIEHRAVSTPLQFPLERIATDHAVDVPQRATDNPAIPRRLCGKDLPNPDIRRNECVSRAHVQSIALLG